MSSSVGEDLTSAYLEIFDVKRDIAGLYPDLVIVKYDTVAGYQEVLTLSNGWFGERIVSHRLGEEFFEFQIAEDGIDLTPYFIGDKPSHLKMKGEDADLWLYYKFRSAEEPVGTLRIWKIECSPTGERKPA
jgi:hypothetical protein